MKYEISGIDVNGNEIRYDRQPTINAARKAAKFHMKVRPGLPKVLIRKYGLAFEEFTRVYHMRKNKTRIVSKRLPQ